MEYLRAVVERGEARGEAGEPIRFTASTGGVKRDGKDLDQNQWDLENYRRNPIFLWVHDYWGERLPIGRAAVEVEEGRLVADVSFDQEDEFARAVESKYRRGFLHSVSVGWDEVQRDDELRYDLLDISGVPVPGDPDALMEREMAGLRRLRRNLDAVLEGERAEGALLRRAHPPHSSPKADEGLAWDGAGEVARAEGEAQLWQMHAWRDDELDPETKRAYKLPHHLASGEVVWRGVAAAMGRLLQAATQIPDQDRRGVYNHLARHYGQFDKEVPEFRSVEELAALGPELVRKLFLEDEAEMWPELFQEEADAELVALHAIICGD